MTIVPSQGGCESGMVVALWWLMRVVAQVVMMASMMLAVSVKKSVIMQMLLRFEQGELSQSKKSSCQKQEPGRHH